MAKANLNVSTQTPTGTVPAAIRDAGMIMGGSLGFGSGAPDALCSSVTPPGMSTPDPQMIERYGEPYGGVVEYLNRWAGR